MLFMSAIAAPPLASLMTSVTAVSLQIHLAALFFVAVVHERQYGDKAWTSQRVRAFRRTAACFMTVWAMLEAVVWLEFGKLYAEPKDILTYACEASHVACQRLRCVTAVGTIAAISGSLLALVHSHAHTHKRVPSLTRTPQHARRGDSVSADRRCAVLLVAPHAAHQQVGLPPHPPPAPRVAARRVAGQRAPDDVQRTDDLHRPARNVAAHAGAFPKHMLQVRVHCAHACHSLLHAHIHPLLTLRPESRNSHHPLP